MSTATVPFHGAHPARFLGVSEAMRELIAEQAQLVLAEVLSQVHRLELVGLTEDHQTIQAIFSDEAEAVAQVENIHDNARILLERAVLNLAHAAGFDWVTL